jgi:hypothetical protein
MARPRPFRAEGRLAAIAPFAAGVLRSVPSRDGPVPAAAHPVWNQPSSAESVATEAAVVTSTVAPERSDSTW